MASPHDGRATSSDNARSVIAPGTRRPLRIRAVADEGRGAFAAAGLGAVTSLVRPPSAALESCSGESAHEKWPISGATWRTNLHRSGRLPPGAKLIKLEGVLPLNLKRLCGRGAP